MTTTYIKPKGVREADTFKDFDNMYIRTRRSIWSSWGNFEYNILPKSYKNFITRFRQTLTQKFHKHLFAYQMQDR